MRDHDIVQVIRLHMSREGASESALFVSEREEDLKPIIERAALMGIKAEIDVDGAPLATCAEIVEWLEQFDRTATPPPAIERPEYEQRLDELTRAQRNADRKLDRIMELLEGKQPPTLAERYNEKHDADARTMLGLPPRKFGVPDDAVPPATPPAPTYDDTIAQHVDRLGRARPIEQGEHTQGGATRAITQQITGTGGVLPGNMALQGGSASSEVFGPGVDANGNPGVKLALPKVGDSLKPLHMRNG